MISKEKMIGSLQELISIESVAINGTDEFPYGEGPSKALSYVLNLCNEFGFRTKNANGKYGYAEIGQGETLIGILTHLDVVPAGKDWDYPPFQGTIVADRMYGRGTIDDKGPAIACIFAMKEILDSEITLNKRIRLIFGQTEENGDWKDMEEYKENEELPYYGFTPDGDFPALYGEKGIMLVRFSENLAESGFVKAEGGNAPNAVPDFCNVEIKDKEGNNYIFKTTGKSSHGCAPWSGDNAITKMMAKLVADKELHVPFAKKYMKLVGDSVYGEAMGIDFSDEESGRLTMNAGMIKVVDDTLYLYLDIRYPVTYKVEDIMTIIKSKGDICQLHCELIHHQLPVYMDKKGVVMESLLSAYREVTGDNSEALVIGGGTYARSMDNIIAFGPNFPGHENREHQENEYILIEDLCTIRVIYEKALKALLLI